MGTFDEYPYTDLHELNLDWILQKIKELEEAVEQLRNMAAREAGEGEENGNQ